MRWDEHVARIPCVYHERYRSRLGHVSGDTHLRTVNSYVPISTAVLQYMQLFIETANGPKLLTNSILFLLLFFVKGCILTTYNTPSFICS